MKNQDRVNPYRVLLVVQSLRVGGAETMVATLARALRDEGCEIEVVALQAGESFLSEQLRSYGVRLTILGKKNGFDMTVSPRLASCMRAFRPDVVHSHLPILHYVVPAARRAGVDNVVHTLHNIAQKEVRNRLTRAYCRHCYRMGLVRPVAISDINAETVVEVYNVHIDSVDVVLNGIDLARYRPLSSYELDGPMRIAHVGRFMDVKNQSVLIESASILAARGIPICVDFYGVGPDLERCKALAKQLHMEDCVTFHGLISDVPRALARSDVFAFPSKYEGVPMALLEAMACGLPIVASPVGGVPDILSDGVSGLLRDPDASSFAEAIEALYASEDLRFTLGMHALERSKCYSSVEMARNYMRVYRKPCEEIRKQ